MYWQIFRYYNLKAVLIPTDAIRQYPFSERRVTVNRFLLRLGSDLARQLYFRAKAGDAVSPYNNFKVPSAVQGRQKTLNLHETNCLESPSERCYGILALGSPQQMNL
ncbi:hypothetical protein GQ600_20006 [Phytophthora cactorum]|nr:hypothetical protein GQ600_20006 [Phytophthora cactorum]